MKRLRVLSLLLALLPLCVARATPVEIQFPAGRALVFTGAAPHTIHVEIETGLAIASLTVKLELRRYDGDGKLAAPDAAPASTAEATDDMRGGGGPVHLQLNIPATGFYELTALAIDADGQVVARKRTVLAALPPGP